MRRAGVLVVALLVGLAAVYGGWAAPAPTTFRIAIGIDPDTLDPAQTTTTTAANVLDYVVETLTTMDPEGRTQPLLAESWTVSPDGRTVTFRLRRNVRFHDGTLLNAQAVKWNLDRVLDPKVRVPIRAPYLPIARVDAVDPFTVRLTLKDPAAYLVAATTWTTVGIVSPASVGKFGNTYENIVHPIGTGPYVYESRVRGERLVLERFPRYWGRKPFYDRVVVQVVPEATTRESLLLAGQADLIILPPAADIPMLQRNPNVKVLLAKADRSIFVAINTQRPPFQRKEARQALNYAVNKGAIIRSVLFGAADPLDAPMPPVLFGYCRVGTYSYDPSKAKSLLAQSGVAPGTEVELLAPTGRYLQDFQAAQAIAGYLREAGLRVSVRTMDWPSYVATITKPLPENLTQMHLLGWAPAYLDAHQQMLQFWSTQWPPAGLATSFYRNPRVDQLIEAASREVDPGKRKDLYCQASRIIWEEAPWIFLWVQRFPIVYSARVTNVTSLPNEKFYAVYAEPTR